MMNPEAIPDGAAVADLDEVAGGRIGLAGGAHAQQLGANAVVGIRYDATEVMNGVTEVLCYGTAVVVERSA